MSRIAVRSWAWTNTVGQCPLWEKDSYKKGQQEPTSTRTNRYKYLGFPLASCKRYSSSPPFVQPSQRIRSLAGNVHVIHILEPSDRPLLTEECTAWVNYRHNWLWFFFFEVRSPASALRYESFARYCHHGLRLGVYRAAHACGSGTYIECCEFWRLRPNDCPVFWRLRWNELRRLEFWRLRAGPGEDDVWFGISGAGVARAAESGCSGMFPPRPSSTGRPRKLKSLP